MNTDLELHATRLITVNKTGKLEIQSYSIQVVNFDKEVCKLIVNSSDPYAEYCKLVKEEYTQVQPIYTWDNKFLPINGDLSAEDIYGPDEIIGYEALSKCIIDSLDLQIKAALDNDYELEWVLD
jgi:hypothetical protein